MKNKQLRVIIVVVFALILAITGLTTKTMLDANQQFLADGFVLIPSRQTEVTTNVNEQYYFSAGANYRKKFGDTINFKDTSNKEVSMGVEEFLHYNDGSLGAFTKGVVMDLAEIGDNQVTYYGVSDKTTILKEGQEYSMSYLGNSLKLKEFIWKIADDTFMLVAPQITIHLAEGVDVVLEDYIQVQYVSGGIARLVHQHGTYQTVSNDAYLSTDSGFQLKLTERAFYNGLEKAVSLDEMVIDSSSNLMVDEDKDNVKIPTFRVVNGKDGADGNDGLTGQDGLSGEDGSSGENGQKGQNGFDGLEGNSGEWGYDGKVGESGEDAGNKDTVDGIVGVVQEGAPIIGIDPDSYVLGTNNLAMMLKITNGQTLVDDLEWSIYKRDTMELVDFAKFSSGVNQAMVSTWKLEPGVDYVFMVEGSYESKAHGLFKDVNFMTKIFKTDELGLSIEKVQVTEDSIMVKTVKTPDSLVTSYQIALYEGDDITNISPVKGNSYVDGEEFIFENNNNVTIKSNTDYKIQIVNVESESKSVAVNVSKEVKTLKIKPYYTEDGGITKTDVSAQKTKILTSSRYQTATLSLDASIVDVHKGIKGYRYELYQTLTDDPTLTTPIQTKELQTMDTVTFNIEANKKYFGRVVILFDDNEKVVELVSTPSDVVSLSHSSYPTVKFITADGKNEGVLTHTYDSISGYIMVEDKSVDKDMLLGHVNPEWPLIVTVTAQAGTVHQTKISTKVTASTTPPEGFADTGEYIAYYPFYIDGLARDITHTVTVQGYVNDTNDRKWDELTQTEKHEKLQYLSGYNVNVGSPTPIVVSMKQVPNVDDSLFTVALAFTDENGNDASYEVSNMEKITFRLVNDATNVTIGTTARTMDDNDFYHVSDYSNFYSSHVITPDKNNLPYSAVENGTYTQYVLTDASFNAKGDSRLANGGTFRIEVETAYDYTQQDEFPEVENELDISGSVTIDVKKRHGRVTDPNSAVTVTQIKNEHLDTPKEGLDDDTVVGLKVDTGYSLADAYKVIYYVYELTGAAGEPVVSDDATATVLSKSADPYWNSNTIYKTKTVMVTNAADEGGAVPLWTVHFDETDKTKPTANIADKNDEILFERGKVYFIRYEVVTNKSLDDTAKTEVYPHCAYSEWGADYATIDEVVPFYRSNVFGLERQEPKLHRYLWDTISTTDTSVTPAVVNTTQQWKYLLDDPDNTILAAAGFDKAVVGGIVTQYDNFDNAINKATPTVLPDGSALFTNLYDDAGKPKNTYDIVEMTKLKDGKWYTLEIPYCLFNANTNPNYVAKNAGSLLSMPGEVKAVNDINTNITDVTNNYNSGTDYVVNGVMVKDVVTTPGIGDEYGYRIKLTLQGTQIERVAAVRVTVTSKADPSKVVVYDPVPVKINNYMSKATPEATIGNYYGYAYLEYAPIVEAGINQTDTTIKVEAYYTSNRAGMKSFAEYNSNDIPAHNNTFTGDGNVFAGNNAWAMKKYQYTANENTGFVEYSYDYLRPSDHLGNMGPSGEFAKDNMNDNLKTKVLSGSVFIPEIDGTENKGFKDDKTLAFRYSLTALANTELPHDDHSFNDVMYPNSYTFEMDETGAKNVDDSYYVLEQLNTKPLMIDFGEPSANYLEAEFHTGDGMPGISYAQSGTSTGMSSATVQFDIKGSLPDDEDSKHGFYIYLYKVDPHDPTLLTPVNLHKYEDKEHKIYYLVEGQPKTTDDDTLISNNNSAKEYALLTDADSDGKKLTYAIRGLEKETTYKVQIMAKDTLGVMKDLFDFTSNPGTGGLKYQFITKSKIDLVSGPVSFIYNAYNKKSAAFQYAVKGNEGTGMRIFYKVYDENDAEVKCGKQPSYSEKYGYCLEPLGTQVHYYQSDMTKCHPVYLDWSPNGLLKAGERYKIVYLAYRTNNDGLILESTPISDPCTEWFEMPSTLQSPSSSLQVVSGADKVTVRLVVFDKEKSIYNGKVYVDAYDMSGNKVTTDSTQLTIDITEGTDSTIYVGDVLGLQQNQVYKIVVTANVDKDNNGSGETPYKKETTASTTITANATVSLSYTGEGKLAFKLMDVVNFGEINRIVYSIDSENGASNYENGDNALTDWVKSGNTYSHTTDFVPKSGDYHYTIQFYKDGDLKGSTSGYFTK